MCVLNSTDMYGSSAYSLKLDNSQFPFSYMIHVDQCSGIDYRFLQHILGYAIHTLHTKRERKIDEITNRIPAAVIAVI